MPSKSCISCIVAGILCFFSCNVIAKENDPTVVLKAKGYELANYEMCVLSAQQNNDPVMKLYYADMKQLTVFELQKGHYEDDLQMIKRETDKAFLLLKKMSRTSVYQYCSNRFNLVSRQYYQAKLNAQ